MFVDGRVGLGIQRLRVVDLATGDQPIRNEDGSVVVVLNGEIYNFRELRRELLARGHRLRTEGDTETIVHLYEEFGVDCVQHLHGMFAFALWDARRQQLLIARDRVGKKPLFYSFTGGELVFASELGALMQDASVAREIDPAAIDCYLTYGYVPTPHSIFKAVRKLPPAHTLVLRDGTLKLRRYWQLDYSQKLDASNLAEIAEEVRRRIRIATERRLISDVPLGAFLSGGIDSSAVVAAMAEASSTPVKTFSIGFEDGRFDELRYARQVAERFGTEHHEFVVRPSSIDIAPRIVRHYGEPFADPSALPSFQLAALTRKHVTVALNGDGGDESFGGYTRYVSNRLAGRLDSLPAALRRLGGSLGQRLHSADTGSLVSKARRLSSGLALPADERYLSYVSWFNEAQRRQLYTSEFCDLANPGGAAGVLGRVWEGASGSDVVDVMLEVDASTYLVDDLITKIDIATMAHGLEARSPLLDHELMQFAASIPADLKVRGKEKKWILRQALRGWIPNEILDRPKQGFTVPVGSWFRQDLRQSVTEVLLDRETIGRGYFDRAAVQGMLDRHLSAQADESKRLWALFMLELWHREFVDDLPAPVGLQAAA